MILLGNIHLHSDIDAGFYHFPAPKLIRFSFLIIEHAFPPSALLKLSFPFLFLSIQPACAYPGSCGLDLSEYQQSA